LKRFNEHGHYQVCSDDDIIYYRVTGMWNIEASLSCIEELELCFKQSNRKSIAMIVDTTEFEGGLDDAFQQWISAAHFWYTNGLKHFIRIDDPHSAHYQLFLANIDVMVKKHVNFNFASNLEDALQLAHQFGFKGTVK